MSSNFCSACGALVSVNAASCGSCGRSALPPEQSAEPKPLEKMSDAELHTAGLEQAKNKEQGKSFDAGLLESLRTERQRRLDAGEWSHPDRSSSSSPSKPTAGKTPAPVKKESQEAGKGATAFGCLVLIFAVAAAIGGVNSCIRAVSDSDGPSSAAGPDTATASPVMPDVTGLLYSEARDLIDDLPGSYSVDDIDLLKSRSIWAQDNWTVMDQSPRAGRPLMDGSKICLGVVKNDETWQTLKEMPCYERLYLDQSTLKFVNHQEVQLTVSNAGPGNAFYRAIVHYELDEGDPLWPYWDKDLYVEYCSDYPIAPGPARMVVLEMNNRYNTDESKWLQYRGKFRYSLDKAYKSPSKCVP